MISLHSGGYIIFGGGEMGLGAGESITTCLPVHYSFPFEKRRGSNQEAWLEEVLGTDGLIKTISIGSKVSELLFVAIK